MAGPLAGIKVIEVGQAYAGPLAGNILADMGADVIKVEKPDGGDDARMWGPPFIDESSMMFHANNRNKRSVTLDIKSAADVERLKQLARSADVLIQNLRPGIVDELGIGSGRHAGRQSAADLLLDRRVRQQGADAQCARIRSARAGLWRRHDADRTAGGSADLLRAGDQRRGDRHVVGDRHPGRVAGPPSHRQGNGARYVAVRVGRVLGVRRAQRLSPHRRCAAAVWRRQRNARAVPDVRHRRSSDLRRRGLRPSVRQVRAGARPSGMGRRSALQEGTRPQGAPRRARCADPAGSAPEAARSLARRVDEGAAFRTAR